MHLCNRRKEQHLLLCFWVEIWKFIESLCLLNIINITFISQFAYTCISFIQHLELYWRPKRILSYKNYRNHMTRMIMMAASVRYILSKLVQKSLQYLPSFQWYAFQSLNLIFCLEYSITLKACSYVEDSVLMKNYMQWCVPKSFL